MAPPENIQVPDVTLVIVPGKENEPGACVVTPISSDPAHLSITSSIWTSSRSSAFKGWAVNVMPKLKSSFGLQKNID